MNKKQKIYLAVVIFYIIATTINIGYYKIYPSIPIYPDSNKELELVKNAIANRTQEDIDFFFLTNENVAYAFLPHVKNEDIYELKNVTYEQGSIILTFKYLINRIRPWQLDSNIKPINIDTAKTPAFPAGHAYQAAYLANHLSKKYPDKKDLFQKIALDCDYCRIKAGLHYPSDGIFARKLVSFFN